MRLNLLLTRYTFICLTGTVMLTGCMPQQYRHPGPGGAFIDAVLAPETLYPLAAAGLIAATGSDRGISEWAGSRAPVFGSPERADEWSDRLVSGLRYADTATTLLVRDGRDRHSVRMKLGMLALGIASETVAEMGTGAAKNAALRERPDGSDRMSFPSAHSADAGVHAALAARNLGQTPLPPAGRQVLRGGIVLAAAGAGWSRVEARRHYLSDVLAGMAVGCFMSNLLLNAFLPYGCSVSVDPLDDVTFLSLRLRF
jgi:hypothetical protein